MATTTSQTGLRVIRAMLIVIFFGLFAKAGGFLVKALLIGRLYGSGEVTDAYFAAYLSVIFLISAIALKGIMPALMPLFIEEMERRGEATAWEFASGVTNLVIAGSLAVAGACILFTPEIMRRLVPGFFSREAGSLSVTMVRIMAPGLVALCLSVVAYALLNSYKIFSIPSAAAALQNLVWAAVLLAIILFVSRSATAIAVGFVFGAAAQIALNLYGLRGKLHFYRLRLGGVGLQRLVREALILFAFALVTGIAWWRLGLEEGKEGWQLGVLMGAIVIYLLLLWWRARGSKQLMGRFVALMVPLLLGIIIAKYRDLATNYFTSFTQSGIFSDKQFAESVGNLPTVLWAYALAIAMFPYLCEMASRKDLASFGSLITRALRMIALFFVPLSLVMVILARPIVQVVYDNGSWPARHVGYCGLALAAYSAAMFFYAIENVLMQSFFSIQRMWAPTVVGMISSIGQFLFLYVGIVALGHNQPVEIFWFVIVAFPISRTLKNLILIFILRYHVPILPAKETVAFGLRLAAVAAVVAGVTYASYLPISKALKVSSLKAEDIVVDTFNPGEENALGEEPEAGATVPHGWRKVRPAGMRVENVAQGDEPAEFALRADIPGFSIERDLSKFDLSRASTLSFKVKSDREAVLRVTLTGPEAQRDYKVTIKKSEKREKYEVALGNPLEAKKPQAILFEDATPSGPSGALWLDTIVFKGSFTTGQRVKFEIFKLIQALVPMGLGILALVGAAVAFRVEEMRIIYVWLKEEGLARIKDKIKGGKGRREGQGAATGPKAAPMPDVE